MDFIGCRAMIGGKLGEHACEALEERAAVVTIGEEADCVINRCHASILTYVTRKPNVRVCHVGDRLQSFVAKIHSAHVPSIRREMIGRTEAYRAK
jgi:hypothetical protein